MAKDTYLKKVLGCSNFEKIRTEKVLMVGAGGIGCELLKDLVLTGYGEIHIIDLDTITLSNLNRQFLFRKTDIDKSKSLTVKKAVESFNYLGTKLVSHHGNIMDKTQFPLEWWEQFSCIYNALDNIEARKYVNKMCLFLRKPLMECGTEGYQGHVNPIFPYYSSCFDCEQHTAPKTYPVCTIRSTPSLPVHCITWAKEFLFHQLFDESEGDNESKLNDSKAIENETDNNEEIENLAKEANELMELREKIKNSNDFVESLIEKIFKVDIERLLLIDTLWTTREKPTPLDLTKDGKGLYELLKDDSNEKILLKDQKTWSVLENLYALYKSSSRLQSRLKSGEPFVSFDKDDEDTLVFVAAASNLRSHIFNIPTKSKFDIKEIAGNIIPAIATTNAIIAGFSAVSGLNVHQSNTDIAELARTSSIMHTCLKPKQYITHAPVDIPNPNCAACSLVSRGIFNINKNDYETLTLSWLVEQLVKLYKFSEEDISIQVGLSKLIYDIDFDDYLNTKLSKVPGFKPTEIILIQDDSDELENLELYLNVGDEVETKLPEIKLRAKRKPSENSNVSGNDEPELEDGLEVIEGDLDDEQVIEIIDAPEEVNEEPPTKKRKVI
ncbi:UBA2 [Candida pseudojiufengensis]|uniref:UBA2 n=1 Tax=Candida pseudojiufengensis TaxID=497109 RepID=UPI002224A1F7|nr:UBA2 [Candida pseudojiufengensis]KAI5963573.1 UBA2 [Candida pseudojiufengensis]